MTYYSQPKAAIHLSNKFTLQFDKSEGLQKVVPWFGYEKNLVFLGTQNIHIVSKIMDTT